MWAGYSEEMCAICLEPYCSGETQCLEDETCHTQNPVLYLKDCHNFFHFEYACQWLDRSSVCPICRTYISESEDSMVALSTNDFMQNRLAPTKSSANSSSIFLRSLTFQKSLISINSFSSKVLERIESSVSNMNVKGDAFIVRRKSTTDERRRTSIDMEEDLIANQSSQMDSIRQGSMPAIRQMVNKNCQRHLLYFDVNNGLGDLPMSLRLTISDPLVYKLNIQPQIKCLPKLENVDKTLALKRPKLKI